MTADEQGNTMSTDTLLSQMPLDLGDNLMLRFARPDDIDALADFYTNIVHETVALWLRDLMSGRHPTVKASDFTVVEDTHAGKIVSAMCLISQTWSYGAFRLRLENPKSWRPMKTTADED